MKPIFTLLTALFLVSANLFSQQTQTVGLFMNTEESFDGYTLFSPALSNNTYLINNCGEKVHTWQHDANPGLSCYLLENGNLLRPTAYVGNRFNGRWGGRIQIVNWESEVIWEYILSDEIECQHHDVEYMPNGNILAVVWKEYSIEEAKKAGRVDAQFPVWSEKIVEIKPNFETGGGEIVWEWDTWDHLVQDVDPTLENYGNVAQSPEKVNVNFLGTLEQTPSDWLHFNSVYYNEKLDQIVISVHAFSEIWIIDHSTTTQEAAGSTGGNSGKGGDLLYRWGNPQAYNQGTASDQQLFLQHDANWIPEGYPDGGMIIIYNNVAGTPENAEYSTVNVINPPLNSNNTYNYTPGTAYLPAQPHWTYKATPPTDFYSSIISGAKRLPNGNTLMCAGVPGLFLEVDYQKNTVWKYINPVGNNGLPTPQFVAPDLNLVFKINRYGANYPGLADKILTPQGAIEPNSEWIVCDLYPNVSVESKKVDIFCIYPNPVRSFINVEWESSLVKTIVIHDITGKVIFTENVENTNSKQISLANLSKGTYLVSLLGDGKKLGTQKLIIQ